MRSFENSLNLKPCKRRAQLRCKRGGGTRKGKIFIKQTSFSKECGCQPAGADCAERRGRGRSELISELFVRKEDLRMACSCDERVRHRKRKVLHENGLTKERNAGYLKKMHQSMLELRFFPTRC